MGQKERRTITKVGTDKTRAMPTEAGGDERRRLGGQKPLVDHVAEWDMMAKTEREHLSYAAVST